jgi:hypothetical protein
MRTARQLHWQIVQAIMAEWPQLGDSSQTSAHDQSAPAQASLVNELLCSPQLHRCLVLLTCAAALSLVGNNSSSGKGSGGSNGKRSSSGSNGSSGSSGRSGGCSGGNGGGSGSSSSLPSQRAQAATRGYGLPVSALSSRLFELLGVELATVEFAASQVELASQQGVFSKVVAVLDNAFSP